jgi:hypothetical protein
MDAKENSSGSLDYCPSMAMNQDENCEIIIPDAIQNVLSDSLVSTAEHSEKPLDIDIRKPDLAIAEDLGLLSVDIDEEEFGAVPDLSDSFRHRPSLGGNRRRPKNLSLPSSTTPTQIDAVLENLNDRRESINLFRVLASGM